jgi:hypothetical protein
MPPFPQMKAWFRQKDSSTERFAILTESSTGHLAADW